MVARSSPKHSSKPRRVSARQGQVSASQVNAWRMFCVFFGFLSVMAGITYRLINVQIMPDERVQEEIFTPVNVSKVQAPRGDILDRKSRTIALSLPAATIVANPRVVKEPEATAKILAEVLDIPEDELVARLSVDSSFRYLARQIDNDIGERVSEIKLTGIGVVNEPRRQYPNGVCSSVAVTGRVNVDHVGMSGLEESYNSHLSGTPGRIVKEIGVGGISIPGGVHQMINALPGKNMTITLDRNIQYQTEQIMVQAVSDAAANSGVAVAVLPATGEIVSMVNIARNSDGLVGCTGQNMAATWSYEPGSVFKPVTAAAALTSGVVEEDTIIKVPPAVTMSRHRFEDDPWHEEADWTLADILSVSSNVGAIKLAELTGEESLYKTVKDLGFGSQTSLAFKGEAKGIMLPLDKWNKLTLPTVAIGQGIAVTPLQMMQMYSTIANGGVRVPLRLIAPGSELGVGELDAVRVISEEDAAALMRMLVSAVKNGTGRKAAMTGFTMAGKTGTAWQPCDIGYACVNDLEQFSGRHYTASFAGIVSNDDGPVMVVMVVIDDPQSAVVSGGSISAPAAKKIAEYALRQLRVPTEQSSATQSEHEPSDALVGDSPVGEDTVNDAPTDTTNDLTTDSTDTTGSTDTTATDSSLSEEVDQATE